MIVKTNSAHIKGLEARNIGVEVSVTKGIPAFSIVGLASKSVSEARDRVYAAMNHNELEIQPKKILINLSPAHIKKDGSQFDLAIAASLMAGFEYLDFDRCTELLLEDFAFLGELSLTGEIKAIKGALPLALEIQAHKEIKHLVVPYDNAEEVNLISLKSQNSQLQIYALRNILELRILINNLAKLQSVDHPPKLRAQAQKHIDRFILRPLEKQKFLASKSMDLESLEQEAEQKLGEIIGQSQAKRAFEIAAAGEHHILMVGPPGCGKSMLAHRIQYLLPQLELDEALELSKIYSISGLINDGLVLKRPVRSPHHSSTAVSLTGGGVPIKPGEVSLAHHGVLFLDELTEFNRYVIEQLRQIMDSEEIILNRGSYNLSFPAKFMLVAACNPCPCGFLGDLEKACSCSSYQIARYISKLSGPILDRIDIHLELTRLTREEITMLSGVPNKTVQSTGNIRKRIVNAKSFARELRGDVHALDDESRDFVADAIYNLNLSARAHSKVIKLARTIANLAQSEAIQLEHLAEAMMYRSLNWEKYMQTV